MVRSSSNLHFSHLFKGFEILTLYADHLQSSSILRLLVNHPEQCYSHLLFSLWPWLYRLTD